MWGRGEVGGSWKILRLQKPWLTRLKPDGKMWVRKHLPVFNALWNSNYTKILVGKSRRILSFGRPRCNAGRNNKRSVTATGTVWTGLNWTELDWTGLNWTELDWTGLKWTEMDWTSYCNPANVELLVQISMTFAATVIKDYWSMKAYMIGNIPLCCSTN